MADIFISYSREDQATARQYAEGLQREGLRVWWDVALNPGETFDKVTEQALREAKAVVVLWSRTSVESRWVRSEATQADRYGTLVPVMIEPCERPIMFELAHTMDLSGWNGDVQDPRWQPFLDSVRRFVSKDGVATAIPAPADARSSAAPAAHRQPRSGSRMAWAGGLAAVVAIVAVVTGVFLLRKEPPTVQAPLMRLTLSFPDDVIYSVGEDFVRSASISPDGRRVVFTGNDRATSTARLFVRMIDSTQSTPLQGSEDGTEPFWSPDSRFVGFYSGGKVRIASVEGGVVRELADASAAGGASWNGKGQVLLSLKNPGPLMMVPAAGGTPNAVTALEKDDVDHDWPQFLDDGEHFLYLVNRGPLAPNQVYLASLREPGRTLLLENVRAFAYAPPGRIIFLQGPVLYAQMLDLKQGKLVGDPAALAENALPPFSASRTGALTYRSVPTRPNPLIWIDADGKELGEAAPPGYYTDPQISPDGKRVALAVRETANGPYDVAILDLATRDLRKLTVNAASDRSPVWSPDGQSIVFVSMRPDAPGLYRKNANGVGAEQLILPSPGTVWPYQWKPGRLSIFDGITGALDVAFLTGDDLSRREVRIATPANDVDGAISPDGKWLAYTSNASGRWELYLTTVEPSATMLSVTSEGACDPTWSIDGRTLYYTRPSTAELMAVSVMPGDPPTFGKPRRIHHGPLEYPSGHSIDVAPDGERLILAPSYSVQGDLTILVNWQSASPQ